MQLKRTNGKGALDVIFPSRRREVVLILGKWISFDKMIGTDESTDLGYKAAPVVLCSASTVLQARRTRPIHANAPIQRWLLTKLSKILRTTIGKHQCLAVAHNSILIHRSEALSFRKKEMQVSHLIMGKYLRTSQHLGRLWCSAIEGPTFIETCNSRIQVFKQVTNSLRQIFT